MFADKKRVVRNYALAFKTSKDRWDRMAKSINNVDFETGDINFPGFFAGPQDATGSIIVFAYVKAGGSAEAWNQVQNRLPVHGAVWCIVAPETFSMTEFEEALKQYTSFDGIHQLDFDEVR